MAINLQKTRPISVLDRFYPQTAILSSPIGTEAAQYGNTMTTIETTLPCIWLADLTTLPSRGTTGTLLVFCVQIFPYPSVRTVPKFNRAKIHIWGSKEEPAHARIDVRIRGSEVARTNYNLRVYRLFFFCVWIFFLRVDRKMQVQTLLCAFKPRVQLFELIGIHMIP